MRYGAESSRYITIGCVQKTSVPNSLDWLCEMSLISFLLQSLQMMCWWAENPEGDEFKHHLA
ncbi:hypothetical protein ACSBR2_014325 [Camellia fascicularis]